MKTLFWGSLIFSFFFLAHIALWNVWLPRRQIKTILVILFGGLSVSLAALARLPAGFRLLDVSPPQGIPEFLHLALFVTALILSYMITYTAIEADSPSLIITQKIRAAGGRGLPREELDAFLSEERLIVPRVKDLVTDKMACIQAGRYYLTPKGRLMAEGFIFYRSLLGLGKGG